MANTLAIAGKELRSYFASPIAYVVIGLYALLFGYFFLLFLTPQSPRWLVAKEKESEARSVLEKCGTDTGNLDEEIRDIRASLDIAHHTVRERFYCRGPRKTPVL